MWVTRHPLLSVLLVGFVISAFLAAIMAFMISISSRLGLNLHLVYSFLFGQISVSHWGQIAVITPLIIEGIIGARFFAFHLNAFFLGEGGAAHLVIEVERDKIYILALGSLFTSAAVSISGLVGFVGLVMPHAVRLILGPDHRVLVSAAALSGAIYLVVADLLARIILAPVEIPVGVITAVIRYWCSIFPIPFETK